MAKCITCGQALRYHRRYTFASPNFRKIYRGSKVFRCTGCGLSQADLSLVDDAALTQYYAADYRVSAQIGVLGETSAAIYRRRGAALAALAARFLPAPPQRVFEVGAGYGFNLRAFAAQDPAVWLGTDEISGVALATHGEQLQQASLDDGPYDVVVLSHVLEHFADPKAMLDRVHAAVSPEGVVVIEVPNDIDGVIKYNGRDEPHLTFFELETLRPLLMASGFAVLELHAAGPDNVRDTPATRAKRALRWLITAVPLTNALFQRRAAMRIGGDRRFDGPNPTGVFLRAVLRKA